MGLERRGSESPGRGTVARRIGFSILSGRCEGLLAKKFSFHPSQPGALSVSHAKMCEEPGQMSGMGGYFDIDNDGYVVRR